jgi:two-component system NtrC family sensor kinase
MRLGMDAIQRRFARRTTTRIVVGVLVALTLVFGGEAWLRLRNDMAAFQADMERDHQSIARVLRVSVGRPGQAERTHELLALLDEAGFDAGRLRLSWVSLAGDLPETESAQSPPALLSRVVIGEPAHWVRRDGDGSRWLVTTVATSHGGPEGPWIEVTESLSGQSAFARSALQRVLVTLVLCLLIAGGAVAWLGQRLVQRREDELVGEARALGERADAEHYLRRAVEDQLRHSDRLSTVGRLAASVAHELGSPLNVVRIHGQEIAAGEFGSDPDLLDGGRQIVQQSDRMIGLLRRLMVVARARTGDPELVPLREVVADTVALVRTLARRSGVTMHCDEPLPVCTVRGVRAELQQVLLNLLVNAVQAMPDGGELSVELHVGEDVRPGADAPTPVARLTVRDTGAGIPADALDKIFEAFYTTKPVGQGTGLGLSVCAGIVREHGGWMTVESVEGEGATFVVHLPLTED